MVRYIEDSNEAVFAVVEAKKIYVHESLTFTDTIVSTVEGKAMTTAKAIIGSIHQGSKGFVDKAKGNVLSIEIVRDQSGHTLRLSQFGVYNEMLVQSLLKGHFILSLVGSLSGGYDVKKNGKGSCIYVVGSHEYQVVCMRQNIASTDVGMLDGF
ncbi:hypothetical protein Tco_1515239 [Tanacetum coccineum]